MMRVKLFMGSIPTFLVGCTVLATGSNTQAVVYAHIFNVPPAEKTFHLVASETDKGTKDIEPSFRDCQAAAIRMMADSGYIYVALGDKASLAIRFTCFSKKLGFQKGAAVPNLRYIGEKAVPGYERPSRAINLMRFTVEAFSPMPGKSNKPLTYWSTSSEYIGSENNLDVVMPHLIVVAGPFLAHEKKSLTSLDIDLSQ